MRTLRLVVLVAGLLAVLGATSAAQAAPKWPIRCTTLRCLYNHINQLHAQMLAVQAKNKAQQHTINALVNFATDFDNCVLEGPVDGANFGDPLSVTNSGDTPSFGWVLVDGCNTSAAVKPALRPLSPGLARFTRFLAIARA